MSQLASLEAKLDELLVKKAPFQIPENGRKWIATNAWIFALVGLVLGIFGALALFAVLGITSTATTSLNTYYGSVSEIAVVKHSLALAWIALAVLVGYLVVLAMSVPKLKAMKKSGWNLTFYSTLFFAVYDIFNWLQYTATGFLGLVFNLLGVLVGLYILFQIRGHFHAR